MNLLEQRGRSESANDVTTWRLLTFLHHLGDPWTPDAATSERRADHWVHDALSAVFEPFPPAAQDRRIHRALSSERLIRLARLFFCGADEMIQQTNAGAEEERLERNARMGEGVDTWTVDEVKLAHLLAIAGQMALDALRLPVVLAEHLGMDDDLTLDLLQQQLAESEWRHESTGVSLGLECAHPAIDYALERALDGLREYRERLRREEPDVSALLPNTFDGKGVRAKKRPGGGPCFERPHIAFQLDQERVRSLLMGRQLYGKPELALREVYQNAVDACRYRRARETCLLRERTGDCFAEPSYTGRIVLRAGVADGRKYVECDDDGIGMDLRHLQQLFAQAGRRFGDSHEFHVEKARWDAAGVPFYPNSRFGIGVFSYFMLADELEIDTRRLNPQGEPGPVTYRVNVVGSGSLFRVSREGAIRAPGTRVRLYLNDPDEVDLDKLLNDVLEWLWLPQVRTELVVEGRILFSFEAGQLTPGVEELNAELIIPVSSDSREITASRLFWMFSTNTLDIGSTNPVRGQHPIILSDGIRTGLPTGESSALRSSRQPFVHGPGKLPGPYMPALLIDEEDERDWADLQPFPHVLVDLAGPYAPELSIDRKEALDWAAGRTWAEAYLEAHGWRALYGHEGLTLYAIAILSLDYPSLLHRLNDHALQAGGPWKLPVTTQQSQARVRVDCVAFSAIDLFIGLLLALHRSYQHEEPNHIAGSTFHNIVLNLHYLQWNIIADRLACLMNADLPVPREYRDACEFLKAPRTHMTGGSTILLIDHKS